MINKKNQYVVSKAKPIWGDIVEYPVALKMLAIVEKTTFIPNKASIKDRYFANGIYRCFLNETGMSLYMKETGDIGRDLPAYTGINYIPNLFHDRATIATVGTKSNLPDLPKNGVFMLQISLLEIKSMRKRLQRMWKASKKAEDEASDIPSTQQRNIRIRELYENYDILNRIRFKMAHAGFDKIGDFLETIDETKCFVECYELASSANFRESSSRDDRGNPKAGAGTVYNATFGTMISYLEPEYMPTHPFDDNFDRREIALRALVNDVKLKPEDLTVTIGYYNRLSKEPIYTKWGDEIQSIFPVKPAKIEDDRTIRIRKISYDENNPNKPIIIEESLTLDEAESRGIYDSYDKAGHGGFTPSQLEKTIRDLRNEVGQLTERAEKAEKEAEQFRKEAEEAKKERDRQQKNFDTFSSILDGEHRAKGYQHDEHKREQETTIQKLKRNSGLIALAVSAVSAVVSIVKVVFSTKKVFAALRAFAFL